jgi:phosphotransferase system enzyme I (PtsP)
VHFRKVVGVLYIQRRTRQIFAKNEVAFLVTIAAQLAGALNSAAPDGVITVLQNERPHSVSFNHAYRDA